MQPSRVDLLTTNRSPRQPLPNSEPRRRVRHRVHLRNYLLLSPYLLSAINPNEPQYVLPGAAYPPSPIASNDYYLLSAIY